MSDKNEYVIWWLSQEAWEAIDDACYLFDWPIDLRDEFQNRGGRAGRGRLWVPEGIPITGVPWPETEVTERATNAGGIVMWRRDLAHVHDLPGFVTDLDMNEILYTGKPREMPDKWACEVAGALAYAVGMQTAEEDIRGVVETALRNLKRAQP